MLLLLCPFASAVSVVVVAVADFVAALVVVDAVLACIDIYYMYLYHCTCTCTSIDTYILFFCPTDAGTISFQNMTHSVVENGVHVTVTLIRENGVSQGIEVDVVPSDLTAQKGASYDFSEVTQNIKFGDGVDTEVFQWTIHDDDIFEYPDEEFVLTLDNIRYSADNTISGIESLHIGLNHTSIITVICKHATCTFACSSPQQCSTLKCLR